MENETRHPQAAMVALLSELIDGPAAAGTNWVLGGGDGGLCDTLENVSAEAASMHPMAGRTTLAGHVEHLRFSFDVFNRWAGGEKDVFQTTAWGKSWGGGTLTAEQWRAQRDDLRAQAHAWRDAAAAREDWDTFSLTGATGSVVHLAYHLGAIRQLAVASVAAG